MALFRRGSTDDELARLAEHGDGDTAFERGYEHAEQGDLDTAERFYRLAIELGEEHALNNLARIVARRGQHDEAEALFRRAVATGDHVAVQNLARVLDDVGREDEALALLEEHAQEDGGTAELLARFRFGREEWREAERHFRRAAEDDRAEAVTCVAVLLRMRDEDDEAERWARRGAELGDPHAEYELGLLRRRRDDDAGAEVHLRRAAEQLDDAEIAGQLGIVLWQLERGDEAAAWFERAARDGSAAAARNLGWLLEERGDEGAAVPWFERAAEGGDSAGATSLALVRWRAGDLDAAERLLRAHAEALPHAALNLGLLLDARNRPGDRRQAIAWLRHAAERGSDGAREHLELLGES